MVRVEEWVMQNTDLLRLGGIYDDSRMRWGWKWRGCEGDGRCGDKWPVSSQVQQAGSIDPELGGQVDTGRLMLAGASSSKAGHDHQQLKQAHLSILAYFSVLRVFVKCLKFFTSY